MDVRSLPTPSRLIGGLIAFQCFILVTIPYGFSSAPPLDVVEGLVWAPHWLIGTYKHPPLPSWLIEISVLLTHNVILGPYLVGQICVALTYWFIYQLGRLLMDPIRAAAGTILMVGAYYFTVPTLEFNHNVIQLPLWSAAVLLYAHLRQKPHSWLLWLGLGALGGFGLYGKYTFAVLLIILFCFSLFERPTRAMFKTARPYVSVALAVAVFSPHLIWLVQHDFEPFTYALERSSNGPTSAPLVFMAAQVADHLPIVLILAVVGIGGLIKAESIQAIRDDVLFLRVIAFGPILLVFALFILSGSSAKDMWAMPMFNSLGLWLVMEIGRKWSLPQLNRAMMTAMALIFLVGIGFIVQALHPYADRPSRSNWPMIDIARAVDEAWHKQTDQPLSIIGGTPFVAGLAALGQAIRPDVMIGVDVSHSPWLSEADIKKRGIAFIFDHDEAVPALCRATSFKTTITPRDPLIPQLTIIICPP